MTLINDSKSFTFFEFLDYDLLEKERTEIRHLIFEKKAWLLFQETETMHKIVL